MERLILEAVDNCPEFQNFAQDADVTVSLITIWVFVLKITHTLKGLNSFKRALVLTTCA